MSAVPVAVRRMMRRARVKAYAVWIDVGGFGRAGDERRDGVVDGEPGPDLLVDQVGQAGAQNLAGSAEVGLELVVAGLMLPPLKVGLGKLVGAGVARVSDGGQQHDQLAGAV